MLNELMFKDLELVRDSNTPAQQLQENAIGVADNEDEWVRRGVALNENTSITILEK